MDTHKGGAVRRISVRAVVICAIIAIILLAGLAGYFFKRYNDLRRSPSAQNSAKSQKIVGEVSKIFLLPTDDEPTVAIIKDTNKLASQPFFKRAQNGDAVIIYAKSHVAVIYREKENRIINATDAMSTQDSNAGQEPAK